MLDVEVEENLQDLEEVFAVIAHQWRQPLSEINSIVGSIDNKLYEKKIEDPHITELLLQIETITKQMSQSIDEHRGYFKKQQRSISFEELFKRSLEEVKLSLEAKDIASFWNVDVPSQFVGDVELLKQIIVTLVNNARDALVSRNIYKPMIKLTLETDNHLFLINVCDNAGGISKSTMRKIFEPDFTTKHSSEGTGLGLFMVKKLLDAKLNASLRVQNVQSGVCFTIEIPKDEKNER